MIGIKSSGSYDKTLRWLNKAMRGDVYRALSAIGREGVSALSAATPVETGLTAQSWEYRVISERGRKGVEWYNTHENDGVCIAILIQYGHGTGTGGYISGIDYVNPAMRPIFERMAEQVWKEVIS